MLNTIIVACMLAGSPTIQQTQQKDTTTVVIKVPKIKKPTWGPGTK